jgi:hypothetical protein
MAERFRYRAPPRPELDVLLKASAKHVMTAEEVRLQRRSWVRGQMMLSHPDMTREEVDKIMDDIEAKGF